MSHRTTLTTLFAILHGSLPYEYDELYVNGKDTARSIVINKENSERTIYITANTSNDDILDVTLCDDAYDDDPIEIYQWDTNDPDLNLADLIAYIEKNL